MQATHAFPKYTRWERWLDFGLHGLGLLVVAVGGTLLLVFSAPGTWLPLFLYVMGLAATYVASTVYHAVPAGPAKEYFRRLDHAMIFVMIAGSYAPYALISLWDHGGLWLGVGVWSAALLGVGLKMMFPRRWEALGLVLYIGMGWAVIGAIGPLADAISTATMVLLVIGGAMFTLGTVFHAMERMPFHNVVWHTFVLAGSACHYAAAVVEFT